MTPLDFLAVILATGAIIEVWHKGSIFETARAYVQAWQDTADPQSFRGRLWELILCPFCKSYHIPLYLFAALLAADYIDAMLAAIVRVIVYGLAATRASNILDGILPPQLRYEPPLTLGVNYGRQVDSNESNPV